MLRVTCPICGKSVEVARTQDWAFFPFCCKRCRMIDLGRWLSGGYRIPAEEQAEEVEEWDFS